MAKGNKQRVNEWFLSGTLKKVTRIFGGAYLDVNNTIEVKDGDKLMHHRVWIGEMMWDEHVDELQPGIELCVTGEVYYGNDGVYNKAKALQII
ncbi:MAG: hypothetical protein HEP71_34240 [Roseivirga sp.]|nr:hypothetical protein [Roseivirga sp.]